MQPARAPRPSPRTRAWALETVRAACRSGRLELDEMEERIDAIYQASSDTEIYAAIAGLPHPPAPLVIDDDTGGTR